MQPGGQEQDVHGCDDGEFWLGVVAAPVRESLWHGARKDWRAMNLQLNMYFTNYEWGIKGKWRFR